MVSCRKIRGNSLLIPLLLIASTLLFASPVLAKSRRPISVSQFYLFIFRKLMDNFVYFVRVCINLFVFCLS